MFSLQAPSKLTEISSPISRISAPSFSSLIVMLLSAAVIFGWVFDIDFLKRFVPGYVVMNPVTAVLFLLSSFALWLLHGDVARRIRAGQVFALCAALVGLIKLCAVFGLFDIGIDRIFFTSDFLDNVTGQPSRMAPTTAFNFLLFGVALLLFRIKARRRFFYPAQYPATAVFLTSSAAIIGYLYHAKAFYAVFSFNPMAIHTAVSFLLLAGGMLLSKHAQGVIKDTFNPDIGERTAKELERFKFALDQSSIVSVTDRRGRIIYVNDKFCEILKYSREELYGQDHRIVNSKYHSKEFITNLWKTISSGSVWRGEIQNRQKDGGLHWVEMTIVPFPGDDGKPYQYVAISYDINARKESEQSVRESEKNYRQLADAMPQMVWVADPTGKVDYFNRRWFEYTGETVKTLLGGNGSKTLIHADDEEQYRERWAKSLLTGENYKVEYRLQRGSDGEYRWHLGQALPVRDAENRIVKWFGTCTDIHEQKNVEEKLRVSQEDLEKRVGIRTAELQWAVSNLKGEIAERGRAEEKLIQLSSIVESSDDAIISKDLDGVILSWNRGAENLYGYTAEEALGKNILLLIPPGREGEEPQIMERIRRGESVEHYETVRLRKDGGLLDLSLTISPTKNAAGKITGASKIARDITERKRIEQVLIESTERERAMIENSLDIICTIDAEGRFVTMNPACFKMWGYHPEELIGRPFIDFVLPEDVKKTVQEDADIIAGTDTTNFENRYLHKNGTLVDVRWTSCFSESEQLVFCVAHDITERKRMEVALSESTKRERAMIENALSLICAIDGEGLFTSINPASLKILGYLPEEMIGQPFIDFIAPDDAAKSNEAAANVVSGEELVNFENRYRHKNGTLVNLVWTAHWSENEQLLFAIASDVTERRQAEAALEKERLFLDAVLGRMTDALVACNAEGELMLFNRAAQKLHGLPAEPLAPEEWAQYYDLYQADGVTPMSRNEIPLFRAFSGETVTNVEMVVAAKNREPRTLIAGGQSIFDTQGRKIGAVVGLHDITDRKRAEEELKVFAAKLERSNTELQDFASVASHDLQEPLRKVQAFGDRLKSKYGDLLNEDGRDYLERMQNAAGRMQTLISDLLTFSRVTSQAQPFVAVDLRRVTDEVLSDLETRIETTNGTIEIGELMPIEADPMQMRQLLQNLIGNALKFNRPDVPPVVKISGRICENPAARDAESDATYCLTVEDNGIGFEDKHAEKIFKVFQRLHGRSEYEGTGIGLAVCRKIAERHGGTITAQSTPGAGTTFTVELPVKQQARN